MIKIVILLAILVIFFGVKRIIYHFTDIKGLPDFINYMPFNCYKCASFWTLNSIYASLIWITGNWAFIIGNAITFLDSIAFTIHQRNMTVKF